MKKKLLSLSLTSILMCSSLTEIANAEQHEIFIQNGHSLVAANEVLHVFDIRHNWDETNQTITIHHENQTIELKIGSNVMVKDNEEILIPTPAIIANNQPYIPVRAVGEAFGLLVDWDEKNRDVVLQSANMRTGMTIFAPEALVKSWEVIL